jgi:signal transduction histidine kinase
VWCDINALVRDCTRVAALRDGLQVEFKVKVDESIARIATDAEMVRQILVNLLGNAIDAIEEHNQPGRITVSTINEADRVVIEVSDSGGGVSPELLARIFDPFFSTKKNGKGYGLGLSISSTLAESLGGGLSVDSKTGEGSKFRLWLPQLAAE